MKIFTVDQLRNADRFTIENEPVASIDLMERASRTLADWIADHFSNDTHFLVFAGKGNNGGDGLAVARMLHRDGFRVEVVLLYGTAEMTDQTRENFRRLPQGVPFCGLQEFSTDPSPATVVIDAVTGTAVKEPLHGPALEAVRRINQLQLLTISIDLPSGMTTEYGNAGRETVRADYTLTLEYPKLSLLLPAEAAHSGKMVVLPIGLSPVYHGQTPSSYYYTTESDIQSLLVPRTTFSHKGNFGHVLLIAGKRGMMGAAVLATQGALRSGCGLVSVHVPDQERGIIHTCAPEALVSGDPESFFSRINFDPEHFSAIGIGCGIGQDMKTASALVELLCRYRKPMVIDADALNLLARNTHLLEQLVPGSVLTPHPGEFERLAGQWNYEQEKLQKLSAFCRKYQVITVLKGAYTCIATPQGEFYFNPTGNPGMSKGGSGDVLTGIIAGLLARGYNPLEAAKIGVWYHGKAGDEAAQLYGEESMTISRLLNRIHIGE